MYYSQPQIPTSEDEKLIDVATSLASIAIEQRQAEDSLQQSEERYRSLYEDNPTMYFTISADGNILSVNEFGAKQLGYSVDELVGRPVILLFYEQDKEAIQRQFAQCLKHPRQLSHWEFRKVRKDGTLLWVKETARMIHDSQGQPIVLIVCEDVTDTKVTAEALRESEQRFRLVVQSATEAIILADEHGNITSWNVAAEKMFGYSPQEVQGKPLSLIVPERYREAHQQGLDRIRSTGKTRSIGKILEAEGLRRNGEEFPVELSLGTWMIGSKRQFCGIIRDVTDRKRAEGQRRLLQHAIDGSMGGVAVHDKDGLFTYINPAQSSIYGYRNDELIGKSWNSLI